jgi:hypothetical protein
VLLSERTSRLGLLSTGWRILAVFHFPLLVDKVGHVIGLGFGVVLPLMLLFLTGSHQLS